MPGEGQTTGVSVPRSIGPAAAGPVNIQRILMPFKVHLVSTREANTRAAASQQAAAEPSPALSPRGSIDTGSMHIGWPAVLPPPSSGSASRGHSQSLPQLPGNSAHGGNTRSNPSGGGAGAPGAGGGGAGVGALVPAARQRQRMAAQELSISVPAIEGCMDSWQFEILLDVINNTAAAPLPQVALLTRSDVMSPEVEAHPDVSDMREVSVYRCSYRSSKLCVVG